jgi:hypothetical protein
MTIFEPSFAAMRAVHDAFSRMLAVLSNLLTLPSALRRRWKAIF